MRARLGLTTIALLAAAAVAAACGANPKGLGQKINRTPLSAEQAAAAKAAVDAGNAAWDQRADEAKLREAIAKWEEAIRLNPADWETYVKLARANYFLADGYLFFDESKHVEFLATYEKGLNIAEMGMAALSTDFERRRHAGTKIEDAAMVLGPEAVPLMYWFATNLGKWAKAQNSMPTLLKHKDRIFKIMSRVYELGPDFFYGAPDRYFGAYYAVAPAFAGGDLQKSREYFDKAIKREPKYLATYVLIAENYAPKMQDRTLYETQLKYVLEAPEDILPDLVPEAKAEKRKAEKLMKEIDEKF
jgi:tetratricopeptide (TPR) repeat protein